ncbi:hypothetical protein [Bradyrhizobium sp. LB11.1]|uniref:hypothetical protein n=1 Tax=Bradyrhizobium sp. LB11.1 TaxID=3156326 RepID=UPI003395F553
MGAVLDEMRVDEARVDIPAVELKQLPERQLRADVVLVFDIFVAELGELANQNLELAGRIGFRVLGQIAPLFPDGMP